MISAAKHEHIYLYSDKHCYPYDGIVLPIVFRWSLADQIS